jgi:hypothetical protein
MTKINGIEISSSFSGGGSNIASDIIFSPPEGMIAINVQDAIAEAASMGGGGYSTDFTPTKKMIVTATCASGIGSLYLMTTQISTSYAKGNGSDIRIQDSDNGSPTGDFFPIAVRYITTISGIYTYSISWADTLFGEEVKEYAITYGDPSADFMFMTQTELSPLISVLNYSILGNNSVIYFDRTMAYVPPVEDWGTAGTQVLGVGDDSSGMVTPYVSPYLWNSVSCTTTINVSNNGNFGFGDPPAASAARAAYAPNSLGFGGSDLYQNWVRQVALPDGFYLQWDGKQYGSAGNIKVTLRYVNGGRWILTWFDTISPNPTLKVDAYINSIYFLAVLSTMPVIDDPTTYGVIVVESAIITSIVVGAEADI